MEQRTRYNNLSGKNRTAVNGMTDEQKERYNALFYTKLEIANEIIATTNEPDYIVDELAESRIIKLATRRS